MRTHIPYAAGGALSGCGVGATMAKARDAARGRDTGKLREPLRLDVRKTYKLFVGGAFVRSESGRSDVFSAGTDDAANVARASRKDLRDAVVAARTAFAKWSTMTPQGRGLVLYRLAEMMDARKKEFVERLRLGARTDDATAAREAVAAVETTLWYAGWCDKYAALLSSRNPVAGPYYNYSSPEAMGVVGVIAPDEPTLLGLVGSVIPPLVSGNAVVAVASEIDPRSAVVFAECLATCDLPPGAVNVLLGRRIELAPHLARHMDVNALSSYALDGPFAAELERLAADNLKRTRTERTTAPADWFAPGALDLANIAAFTETKTIWHPAGY